MYILDGELYREMLQLTYMFHIVIAICFGKSAYHSFDMNKNANQPFQLKLLLHCSPTPLNELMARVIGLHKSFNVIYWCNLDMSNKVVPIILLSNVP